MWIYVEKILRDKLHKRHSVENRWKMSIDVLNEKFTEVIFFQIIFVDLSDKFLKRNAVC